MCGIAGIFSKAPIEGSNVDGMINVLKQRGPDADGKFINALGTAILGHTRLSIIDLSEQANQPFYSQSKRHVIVFNGEIYNYQTLREELIQKKGVQFRTTSDTEVIVEGFEIWGEEIAARLDGMFALAIYDQENHKMFLLRDRIGKKPLFYYQSGTVFAFASEIKALLKIPVIERSKKINRSSVSHFLHLGYIPEPDTIFESIKKFPSANSAVISWEEPIQFKNYWNILTQPVSSLKIDTNGARKSILKVVDEAVVKRLVGDVPIGAFLSGGTDSSLVTALASKHVSQKIKTFSIGFKDQKFDEAGYARKVSAHLRTDHNEYILEERMAMEILPICLDYFDEPFADTSAIPMMLVSKMARREVKVVLTGDGGDELFQGYGSYRWAGKLANPVYKMFGGVFSGLLKMSGNTRLLRVSHLVEPVKIGSIRSHIFSQEQYFFSQQEIRDRILANKNDFTAFLYSDESFSQSSAAERQARFDLLYYLKDDLLVKVDRASMYYGLECRCPLLDKDLIEAALKLPDSLKFQNGVPKWLLKELLSEFLPLGLVHRQKWGFSIPLASWLRGGLRYLIDEHLSKSALEQTNLFNVDEVLFLVRQFDNGKEYLYHRLWVIIALQRWFKLNT
ncbi:asparagine synthase (glutamine-hydrolyzing) [soil metagenome]